MIVNDTIHLRTGFRTESPIDTLLWRSRITRELKMPKDQKKKKKKASSSDESDSGSSDRTPPPSKKAKTESSSSSRTNDKEPTWTLAKNKFLKVRAFKGKTYIDIREYYLSADGDFLPGKKGISMTPEMWQKLKSVTGEVDEALKDF